MLQKSTIHFLEQIAINNNKPWFDEHRNEYLSVKSDFEQLAAAVLVGMGDFDPVFKELQAKDCTMRIFRDVRFSKDKTPYSPRNRL
jgi:uncharacterized protein (TIGR02453 family)